MDDQRYKEKFSRDYTGAVAMALFIANLLFIGIVYFILWGLYFSVYKNASQVSKNHIKQALWGSTITTSIALILVIIAFSTTGFASLQALLMAEIYLMIIVPIFVLLGILGFSKAINERNFSFPIIGNMLGIEK